MYEQIAQINGYDAIGIIGVILYIGSYFLVQMKLMNGNKNTYAILNLLAATAVLISLLESFNLPSAMIQVSWIAISTVGIFLRVYAAQKEGMLLSIDQKTVENADTTNKIDSKIVHY